ncbi:hypothetical protein CMT84_06370 [Elizabethkingia anophelis]|nr:hypothetical protein [Elizabethkingia anophelis]
MSSISYNKREYIPSIIILYLIENKHTMVAVSVFLNSKNFDAPDIPQIEDLNNGGNLGSDLDF